MFHFIVGLFLVGLVIMAMVAYPAFRNFVFVALLIIGGGIWWLIDSSNKSDEKSRAERFAQEFIAATAIKLADLKLENVNLKKASYGPSDFILDGTVTNSRWERCTSRSHLLIAKMAIAVLRAKHRPARPL